MRLAGGKGGRIARRESWSPKYGKCFALVWTQEKKWALEDAFQKTVWAIYAPNHPDRKIWNCVTRQGEEMQNIEGVLTFFGCPATLDYIREHLKN
jgi:hypothetical protein